MATLDVLTRKIKALPDDVFQVFTSSKSPTTEKELAALEKKVGLPFPKELRALLLCYGVLVIEVKADIWPRPKELDVGPAWQFQYGVRVLGVGKAVPQELQIEHAMSPALKKDSAVPYFKRIGAPWLGAFTKKAVGTWARDGFEAEKGDVIDAILREIKMLEDGVSRLRAESAPIDELIELGRAAKWDVPKASDVVDNLKKQSADALAPHLPELAKALLPPGRLSMGCLDIIEVAGAKAFPSVAKEVYAHWGEGDDPYVLALLGNLKIAEPKALKIYEQALKSDDDDTFDAALVAIGGLDPKIAKPFAAKIEARIPDLEEDNLCAAIALVGRLGSPRFEKLVLEGLAEMDDDTFASLVLALVGAPIGKLAKPIVARFAKMDPKLPDALGAIEALVELGIDDKKTMKPIVEKHFLARGPMWAERSNALLTRWKKS